MNEELDQQNSQKNLYQGNYDNDYQESVKASTVFMGGNLSNRAEIDTPKYMNLGAPRERDEEDHAHHANNMRSLFGEEARPSFASIGFTAKNKEVFTVVPKKAGTNAFARFFALYFNMYFSGPHFKLVKPSGVESTTIYSQIKWGVLIVFLAISASSFLTESTLYLKDLIFNRNNVTAADNSSSNTYASSSANSG